MAYSQRGRRRDSAIADRFDRLRETYIRASPGRKALLTLLGVVLLPVAAVAVAGFAVLALARGDRDRLATLAVAAVGTLLVAGVYWGHWTALPVPWVVALLASRGPVGRWFVPCRTVAWALAWVLLVGAIVLRGISMAWVQQSTLGATLPWMVALIVLGWRLIKASQAIRLYGAPAGQGPGEQARGRGRAALAAEEGRATEPPPPMSVDEALAALENMIGLQPVKEQIRSIAASIEAARMRLEAGHPTEKPMRHFVFVGPPGTGKTTVARILGQIFYAYGLLPTPYVVEAQRADLVAEFLGATAVKTNELVDRALGGVLFIDEAYSLVNAGDGQPDRFGNEAVQALLKRAEDDRDQLVIILAGYEKEMDAFLGSNPGLASRFGTRVRFPSYQPAELLQIAERLVEQRGDRLDADARPALWRCFEDVARRGLVDELGNGRFVRSLVERAAEARDVRILGGPREPTSDELVTILPADVAAAFDQLTIRYRGYEQPPSVEEALAELDCLIGLDPVKRQVRSIAAQLQVARMRQAQGLPTQPPMRHFVFVGPPGTGKTTVARILGRVFAALGLLARPQVVEAQRADLVGEHLGTTAVKTNKLVDSALGGVLFIDEAYSLYNEGYSGGDPYGAEAVQTLLKRAEDDRDRLVIILAGYSRDMDRFLATNPGLASRFNVRVAFPSYRPEELREIAVLLARRAGDTWDTAALADLDEVFAYVCRQGWIDELGNGRFVRSLFEKACSQRDMRVAGLGERATAAELTTITSADVRAAYQELAGAPGGGV